MNEKIPLQGAELEEHQRKQKAAKDRQAAQQATLAREQRMLEADEDDSESDDDSVGHDSDHETAVDQGMEVEGATASNAGTFAEPGAGGAKISSRGAIGDASEWAFDDNDNAKQVSYDIYLKGNVSRTTSFFKTNTGATPRFRMFPFVERKKRIDAFGEVVDVGMWLRKGKILEEEAEDEDTRENKRRKLNEEIKVCTPVIEFELHSYIFIARRKSWRLLVNTFPQISTCKPIVDCSSLTWRVSTMAER